MTGYFAELDNNNVCFRVLHRTAIKELADNFIPIPEYNERYLGATYDPNSEEFVFKEPAPVEPPETTEQKLARLEEQNLILMDALADLYEEILTLKEEES